MADLQTLLNEKDIPLENARDVYFLQDGKLSDGHIVFKDGQRTKAEIARDRMYLVFIAFGIVSFGISIYINYKKLKS